MNPEIISHIQDSTLFQKLTTLSISDTTNAEELIKVVQATLEACSNLKQLVKYH